MGELLGAAAFVTSCVVGSMCIIKPFRVERGPFLRDVGFFTFAVILVLVVLWDSKLEEWEAAGLVILYLIYVTVVVVGSYLERRRERIRRQNSLMRDEFREDVVPYHDDPSDNSAFHPSFLTMIACIEQLDLRNSTPRTPFQYPTTGPLLPQPIRIDSRTSPSGTGTPSSPTHSITITPLFPSTIPTH